MPNCKIPGPDGVQRLWIKNLQPIHARISNQVDKCLKDKGIPKWMVTGKTMLCDEVRKGKLGIQFQTNHLTCLLMLWKLMAGSDN